ncbi:aldose 1-epimerase family protein [Sphingomonas sp. QA11]|uniref:aldose 1-epimerase family protein n=1 Tax=Sphingomonas sp. QA11 TaxID=2950605 RepID=UPI00234A4F8F|nr:aldose 1-epimerase family protein [Sphingomonas sp. QA11]WCM25004.1 aldose 1-epimerase family protein [Sphingomonas sp. QA11]
MHGWTLVSISSAYLTAEISTLGAELQSLVDGCGNPLQWNGDPTIWRGRAPILFPVIGLLENGQYRLNGNNYAMPKHGFARHALFELAAHDDTSATFRLRATAETRAIYPFQFQLDIAFTLVDATLTVSATIANHGTEPMPASFGFHPALRWPLPYGEPRDEHRLLFTDEEPAPIRRIDSDGFLLPTLEPTPVVGNVLTLRDDLFVADALIFDALNSRTVVYGASTGPQIKLSFADFPTLGVWTKPGAGFLCIEPWHGFSDPVGFAGDIRDKPGIFEVAPSDTRTMAMSITLVAP